MNCEPSKLSLHTQLHLNGEAELCAGRRNLGRFANPALAEKTRRVLAGEARMETLRAPSFAAGLHQHHGFHGLTRIFQTPTHHPHEFL